MNTNNYVLNNMEIRGTYFSLSDWEKEKFFSSFLEALSLYKEECDKSIDLSDECLCFSCCILKNEVISFMVYKIYGNEENVSWCRGINLQALYVKPKYRRMGVAANLLTATVLKIKEHDEKDENNLVVDEDRLIIITTSNNSTEYNSFLSFYGFSKDLNSDNRYVLNKDFMDIWYFMFNRLSKETVLN